VIHDLTERNRLAHEGEAARASALAAREASQRMEEFLATAAHDLRSPLTATSGYVALAEHQTERLAAAAQGACPELAPRVVAVRDRIGDARQSAEQLTHLLTRLFDTAAIRTGKLELCVAPCDLTTVVHEQVKSLRVAAPDRTIRLHTPSGGQPVSVEADADRIRQVVVNYVTNALKYSPPDRTVGVTVETRRGEARVAVCDAGPGIPEEEQAQLWELFHRASTVTAQGGLQSGSLGLGLHICKAIVEAHGGQVGVESAVGRGSTFWFILPLASPET
jgi:signal transduction histidine kinase